ncbi:uncharacterized protein LOC143571926 isoform X2 [Bidens hawaiensis]|uniref:uncharacterized protein LOC143571926 isoform X2 n=1 Tax=Bidens hawaiensis TaxID=980011 RepID=UPI00404AA8D5
MLKVQVDCVCEGCDKMPILPDSRTTNIEKVGDMLHEFVMWPRFALKLVSKEAPRKSMSTSGKTPSSSSSHGRVSPQINTSDLAMSSIYKPQFIEADPCNDNLQPSFTNMLTTMQQVMPTTHAPDPYPDRFIDPEVDDSWKKIKMMSLEIQELAETLKTFMGERHYIESSSPAGMYRETIVMAIPYVEILQLFCNDWLDFSIVHWFAMDFYKSGMNSKCAFFNPEHINGKSS